ncbi:TauD/TfdA family dioxygenase [Microbispora sp. H10949]|uniref:TauD/TfdA family dioxygenase n=1 Tax=Microbispora sp. H10949 TaxID=2729111 RepID=UPI0015FF3632|nr:TauD/TfdA family dioxygenase [Microbispora sp. H10949]
MVIGIDLVHAAVWRFDIQRKSGAGRAADFSEVSVVADLGELAVDLLGGTVAALENGFEGDALKDLGLVLVPAPGVDGTVFTPGECEALDRYVQEGGAVLILGDGEWPQPPQGPAPFGFASGDLAIGDPADPAQPHVRPYQFPAEVTGAHPALEGVTRAYLYRPKPVSARFPLTGLVEKDGQIFLGVARHGAGRVAVVGNAEMFARPFLGREDNARLLLNLLSWLLDGRHQGSAADLAAEVTGAYRFSGRDFSPTENLKNEPGPHVVDAGVYAHLFTGLADGFLRDSETDEEAFLREAELRFHEMPRVVRQAVSRFRQHGTDSGVLLVKGLPVDPALPPTPADPKARVRFASPLSELWLAAFAQALGEPIGYRQEKNGLLFQNVVPTPHNAAKLSSESSAILLDYHTETAFHPFMPDYVLLHCLRPDHDGAAKTISASLRMALPRLSLRERAILSEPLYRTGIDYSFGSSHGTKGNGPLLRVLYGDPFDPYLTVDPDLMMGIVPEADAALKRLHAVLHEVRRWVCLDTGDLLIVDNRRAVHGRSEFTPRYDGRDRWLQRVCVVRDLVPSAGHRRLRGRIIDTAFAV